MEKHTLIGKFTMKKSLTSYNLLKIKSQIKSSEGITRKQSDLTIKKLKKKKGAGMGGLSNEIFL